MVTKHFEQLPQNCNLLFSYIVYYYYYYYYLYYYLKGFSCLDFSIFMPKIPLNSYVCISLNNRVRHVKLVI